MLIYQRNLFFVLYIALLTSSCRNQIKDNATFFDTQTGITVTLYRKHLQSNEFERSLSVKLKDRHEKYGLEEDTGGTDQMNIYRAPNGNILLRDRLSYYQINTTTGIFSELGAAENKLPATYLGAFINDQNYNMVFVSESDYPEKAPHGMMVN